MTLVRHLAAAVVVGVLLVIISVTITPFRDYQMAEVACYVVAVAGLTVLLGLSGQISLGNGAFMAIGAYAAALLLLHLHWNLAVVLVASAVAAAAGGAVVGVAAARLRGPYLAGATLMLAVALPSLALRFGVLGGDQGLTVVVTSPGFLGSAFPVTRWQAWLTCGCALIVLVLLANLARSRVGRSWRAAGDDEVAAALAGLNVARLRVLAFVVSAACAGLAGALLAVTTSIISPGRVHPDAVHRPAHRRGAGRPGYLARRGVGQPRAGPGPDLRHRHGHQPRPVQLGRVQHPGRGLRRRAHRRHARLPRRHPGWPAPAGRPLAARLPARGLPWRRAPAPQLHAPAGEHQEEGSI